MQIVLKLLRHIKEYLLIFEYLLINIFTNDHISRLQKLLVIINTILTNTNTNL